MADNNQKPKTKVDPLTAGIGLDGLKGLNTREQTQEIKKESQVYTVTKNDGSQEEKSYKDLTPVEKKAANTDGVVAGGKTDVERQYAVVNGIVGTKPTRNTSTASHLGALSGVVAASLLGAKTGGAAGAIIAGGTAATMSAVNAAEEEQKYQQALKEFNDKVNDNTTIAGSWRTADNGDMIFTPDYSKIGEDINVDESGAKISELFNLDEGTEPEVYFTDDNVLHVDINNVFSNTNEYKKIIESVSSDYAGLTKDAEHVDDYLGDIKQRLSSALNQYRFEVNRVAGYKSKLPNADAETIMDAARGEIGAMLADADKKDWPVKVYRDGEIVESNAKEVLDHVYDMKDKYERDDYLETLGDMLNDDSISDNDKAYILSEYNLLFSASDADVKEGDASEERVKYKDMLDQDFLVTIFRSSGVIRGLDNLVDGVAGRITNGEVDDILIANQNYLEPDELAQNIGSITGAAFDVYVSQKVMQGLEQKLVRPVLGAAARSAGKTLISSGAEALEKIGKKMVEGSWSAITNKAGEIIGFRTALNINGLKETALNNVIQAFGSETSGLSCRILAKGGGQLLVWSLGELAINFASDALFDAAKLGTAVLAGEIKDGDEAYQYMTEALGQDLILDLVIQYGPQGMLDMQSTSDAIRLSHIEPYAQSVAKARTEYGEALDALNTAKANKKTTKKALSELETKVTAAKNGLTKAEVDYDEARVKWVGSGSQKFGAKLADLEARMTESEMFRKFQESVMDENVAGTALAKAAYAASGGDVDLFNKLLNTTSNNLRTVTRITANEMASDKWAKGTGEAYNAFKQKYSELASRTGKLSTADVDYIKAKNELIRYTEAANGDKELIAKAQTFYSKYIDGVDQVRAGQLDELMDTMREAINKTNESAINAGIQTEENIQTKRNAAGFQKQGYIPMYLKRKNKTGRYVIGQERNLDHTWDRGDFWDIDNLENPALNTLTYINYTARNIAVNERNKAVIAATEIPGMRTYRTDADNEIIKTDDGHVYKHSDIIDHMKTKIDKRLNRIDKIKRETPTATEFSDGKNEILYGKADGTHEGLVDEFEQIAKKSKPVGLDEIDDEIRGARAQADRTQEDINRMREVETDAAKVIPNLSYKERLDLAERVERNGDYILLYRVQGGKPDKWRPNNRGAKGKFEANGGEEWLKGAVWLTADRNWAEGPDRASAGVSSSWTGGKGAKVTDDNIVVIPVKRSDILNLNSEVGAKNKLSQSGKKIVKTRGIDGGLEKSEYVLWGNEHPEVFTDGQELMLNARNELSARMNSRAIRRYEADLMNEQAVINELEAKRSEMIAQGAESARDAIRADVNSRINAMKEYYDNTYKKFGYTTNVRVSQAKIDGFIEKNDFEGLATYLEGIKNRAALASPTDQTLSDVAFNKQVTGLEIELKRSMDKNFPGLNNEQKREVYSRILGEFRRRAAESGDAVAEQIANEAFVRNVGYPITYYEDGEEKTAYIDGPLAKPVYDMCVRSENVADRNFITKVFEGAGKLKRYATTTIDATRAIPNLLRDTLRGDIMSGGTDYAGARKIFAEILDAEGMTAEQKAKAMESIELAIKTAQGETLNAAIENRTERGLQDMVRETRQEGKNTVSRVIWDVTHGRIGHALETPMNVAESFTRRRMAQSAYIREFKNAKYTSTSFEERLGKAYDAGVNAGIENTTNFSRRGAAVGEMARYVPYFQQNFANIESAKISFMKDPAGVAARAAVFQYAYIMVLADTLKKEETRRAYYNLSDYDRKNNIVFSLDGNTLVTIPVDESLSSLITPWRRTLETLNGIDPGTFASIFTDTLLDLSPIDLDGFTEGDSLNVRRGMEKLASQMAPSLATEMLQTITGYNLYYGQDNAVTGEYLAERGQVAQSAGDYTTASANSKILRKIADATGMPQWMLQQAVSNFGGNVGQYVLNTMDKLAGATEDEQGGKDWIKAVSKSMTGSDTTNMQNQFYNGINELKKEKARVVNKLQSVNEKISVATGTELAELKKEYQNIKDDYAMKVSNFVNQYLSTYEITGGLSQKLASQVYYLFYLYDNDTTYESGSVGEYYQNLAKQQAKNEATSWAAPVLDKYYDQTQNVYKDSSGTWHYYSPYGEKAYYNTIYGQGMKHQVGLRNLIEGVTSNLKSARTAAYDARSAAMDRQDYDLYDKIGADFDAQVVEAIDPYIKEYGADVVLNNSTVLDYLEEWFFVPSSYMKTKKGRFVPSLANNASKQRAFVRPFIKSLYGVDTGYTEKNYDSLLNPEVFENE